MYCTYEHFALYYFMQMHLDCASLVGFALSEVVCISQTICVKSVSI